MFHSNLPLAISGLSSIKQIAVGFDHACAVRSDGTVWCWGLDGVGQLGDGASGSPYITLTAHAVVGLADATQIAAGLQSTCALRAAGNVACWGSNSYGVLGNGSPGMPFATTPITTLLPVPAVSLSHRDGSVLVTTADGSVYGWGVNETGEFGDGIGPIRWVPTLAPALHGAHGFQISAGTGGLGSHCAIFSDGQTRCWGYNSLGQLADGTTVDHFFPAPVIGGLSLSVLSGNGQSRCGISTAGGLYCWGSNYAGELGTGGVVPGGGTSPPNPVPALVSF
jgi:alpha-tubulin suppressor-like RCC1 family protein